MFMFAKFASTSLPSVTRRFKGSSVWDRYRVFFLFWANDFSKISSTAASYPPEITVSMQVVCLDSWLILGTLRDLAKNIFLYKVAVQNKSFR